MGPFLLLFLVFFPIVASFALLLPGRGKMRDALNIAVSGIELLCTLLLLAVPAFVGLPGICGLGLNFTDGSLRTLLSILTAFAWLMTALFCKDYFAGEGKTCVRFYVFFLVTLGAMMGVFLAADLYTLFIFFEVMSFTSFVWVIHDETPQAIRAGNIYLAICVFGGMAMLVGLFLLYHLLGTLEVARLHDLAGALAPGKRPELLAAGLLCLVGFGAKAGVFPLHFWMPKAYPAAPAPGSALLSSILSKSGVFGILIISSYFLFNDADWNAVLLMLSLVTMVLGAVLALFSVDLKRTLACSSMSQIGFILLGIAMRGYLEGDDALASWGTVLHMVNHSLIKLVLFVGAGVVYLGTHSRNLNEIRGWGRDKHLLKATFFISGASLCGIPLFSGYVSKTLLHESIVEYIHILAEKGAPTGLFHAAEWLFLISGGLTLAYMTKIFVAVFVEKRAPVRHPHAASGAVSGPTMAALVCGSLVLAVLGLTPSLTMERIGIWTGEFLRAGELEESFHYFSPANLEGAAISLAIGAAVYFLVVRTLLRKEQAGEILYPDLWPEKLDLENLVYRPLLRVLSFLGALCARLAASTGDLIVLLSERLLFLHAPGVFVPKQNENFGFYEKQPKLILVKEAFSFSLMLSGFGLVVTFLYLLLR